MFPSLDEMGKIIMKSSYELQLSPNGNGAIFEEINKNITVQKCIEAVDFVQIIGIDNILNKVLDPVQIYFMIHKQLDFSLKCIAKRSPHEKLGNICKKKDKYHVIEYSDFSSELAERKNPKTG